MVTLALSSLLPDPAAQPVIAIAATPAMPMATASLRFMWIDLL